MNENNKNDNTEKFWDDKFYEKQEKNGTSKAKKRTLLKFLLIFLLTLTVVVVSGYIYLDQKFKSNLYQERSNQDFSITDDDSDKIDQELEERKFTEAINILILGTDNSGYRSDVTMLVHYDPYTRTTSLFSVPRDYKVNLSKEAQKSLNYYAPYIKFTEIFSYCKLAKMDSPSSFVSQVVEEMLNIKINHFVLVDLKAFKTAVDSVGGVEVYVPQNMKWFDPYQDLNIDLQAGVQLLDGEKAEQLVRFRKSRDGSGYGDFGRMQIQQYFLTAFAKKLLNIDNVSKIKEIVSTLSEMLTTDASLADALLILSAAKDADFDRVNAHTLPGVDSMIAGKYFYSPPSDIELKRYFIKTVLDDAEEYDHDSKSYTIEVYSSTNKQSEKAKALTDKLTEDGYKAEYKGLDRSQRILKSVITVPDSKCGGDLKKYLDMSEIKLDEKTKDKTLIKLTIGEVQAK